MAATALSQAYPLGTVRNERGHLEIGGCDLVELAERHGTPAYVYAEDDVRARARAYVEAFAARTGDFEVVYASKALPIVAAYRLMAEEGLSVDVASGGELYLALRGGVPPERIYLHGNNKGPHELELAFESGIGCLVLDSFDEIELAESLLASRGRAGDGRQQALIRVTPGIKPSTHTYVQTGQLDSKFGFGLEDGLAAEAVRRVQSSRHLELAGLHAHIGSQIFELEPYVKTIQLLGDFVEAVGLECRLLNVGGGLGIAYTAEDEPASIEDYVDVKVRGVQRTFDPVPRILVEPGRSLVGNAGVTVYRIGTVKEIPGVRTYVAVDGGMSDNLRPMLYGSRYDAAIADRPEAPGTQVTTVAGMHCESGDILIRDVALPDPKVGDLLVTPATGAYGFAMASNYNGVPRPPVIFCKDGRDRVVVRRETYEDLAARDE
jgi:diaminopimelate decarboxylase